MGFNILSPKRTLLTRREVIYFIPGISECCGAETICFGSDSDLQKVSGARSGSDFSFVSTCLHSFLIKKLFVTIFRKEYQLNSLVLILFYMNYDLIYNGTWVWPGARRRSRNFIYLLRPKVLAPCGSRSASGSTNTAYNYIYTWPARFMTHSWIYVHSYILVGKPWKTRHIPRRPDNRAHLFVPVLFPPLHQFFSVFLSFGFSLYWPLMSSMYPRYPWFYIHFFTIFHRSWEGCWGSGRCWIGSGFDLLSCKALDPDPTK